MEADKLQSSKFSIKLTPSTGRTDKQIDNNKSAINVKEFFDFLKTAYQVHDNLEDILIAGGQDKAATWLKLKENELFRSDFACQTVLQNLTDSDKSINLTVPIKDSETEEKLQDKLNETLSEGILDSVLLYLNNEEAGKKSRNGSRSQQKLTEKTSNQSVTCNINSNKGQKSNSVNVNVVKEDKLFKTDSEVLIHVCDEVKNAKKDFVCNQKLLIEKMSYFAHVTEGQKLEDMDISVHCDINIFEWLMAWVKADPQKEESPIVVPTLDVQCVVPIAVSAAFLQMEPLLNDCLLFMHRYMNEILRTPANMSCLNDSILTRLAAMYTNGEVEAIRDRKDKIQSKLYCRLIQSMCETEAESVRGHWCTMAYMYRCSKCQQILTPDVADKIRCTMSSMRLLPNGDLMSKHVRDTHWNINDYIRKLHKSLRTWRRVYWRLWGNCHFLYCVVCKQCFPSNKINWCRYHPDLPQFFTVDSKKAPLPIGRFPCCGERAFKFQLLENHMGCKFHEHCPSTENVREAGILETLEKYRHLIEEEPPELIFPERLTRLVARDASSTNNNGKLQTESAKCWWDGLELIPPRSRLGLLGPFTDLTPEEIEINQPDESSNFSSSSQTSDSSTINDSDGAEEKYVAVAVASRSKPNKRRRKKKKKKRKIGQLLWQNKLSTRSNQDLQRTYEEQAFKRIAVTLYKKSYVADASNRTLTGKSWPRHVTPPGGMWTRLEAEWREANNLSQKQKQAGECSYKQNKLRYPKPS